MQFSEIEIIQMRARLDQTRPLETLRIRTRADTSLPWRDATVLRQDEGFWGMCIAGERGMLSLPTEALRGGVGTLHTLTTEAADASARRKQEARRQACDHTTAVAAAEATASEKFKEKDELLRERLSLSPGSYEKVRQQMLHPSPVAVGDLLVRRVPAGRNIVLRQAVVDSIAAPLREANEAREKTARERADRKRLKRQASAATKHGGVPNTKKARHCTAVEFIGGMENDAAITARAEATAARDRAAEIPALLSEIGSGGAETIGVRKLSKLLVWRMQQLGVAMPPGLSAQAKNRSALVQLLDGTRTTRPRCRSARRDARRDTRSDECDRSRNCRPCARGGRRSRVPCCRCCRQRRGPRQRERRRER